MYDNHDMLMYTSRYRKDSSPVYTERDDLDVSPDGTLITAPHPLDGNLNIIVGVIGAARGDEVLPMALIEVHKKLQGQTFKGNYRGRFSPCGRYLGAYGSPRGFRELPDDQRPPHVKVFQKGAAWDEWTEVAFYRAPSGNPSSASAPNLGACSAMAFLPDGAHLVTGAQDGVIRLHGVPDLKVVTTLRVHTNIIHSMRAVSWSGSSTGSGESALILSCSADHWVKVTRVVGPSGGLTVLARYCCSVEPLCVSGFMGGGMGVRADGGTGGRVGEVNVGNDTLYVHAGDTGGLLSILKVDMGELK